MICFPKIVHCCDAPNMNSNSTSMILIKPGSHLPTLKEGGFFWIMIDPYYKTRCFVNQPRKKCWPRTSRRKKSFFFKVERRNFSGEISWHTSTGIQFALVEGLSHELESVVDRFIISILLGRCGTVNCHPVFKRINKTDYPRGKSDQNHVDKRILAGKRLQYEDSTSTTFVRPVRHGSGVALTSKKEWL